jgi:pimeloyl-ACP methyl ester carboxylesterase
MRLYCLPGLGVDHRLFDRCDLGTAEVVKLDWPVMPRGSSLADYAAALAARVNKREPHVLLGVSMGGMVAQEMAAITGPRKVIIVSSWKGPWEMPPLIRWLRPFRPEMLLTEWIMRRCVPVIRLMRAKLGMETVEATRHIQMMLDRWSAEQIRVMVRAVLSWPGAEVKDLVHIHGDRDALMPLKFIRDPIIVRGGTHIMVYTLANEVSAAVRAALKGAP